MMHYINLIHITQYFDLFKKLEKAENAIKNMGQRKLQFPDQFSNNSDNNDNITVIKQLKNQVVQNFNTVKTSSNFTIKLLFYAYFIYNPNNTMQNLYFIHINITV